MQSGIDLPELEKNAETLGRAFTVSMSFLESHVCLGINECIKTNLWNNELAQIRKQKVACEQGRTWDVVGMLVDGLN